MTNQRTKKVTELYRSPKHTLEILLFLVLVLLLAPVTFCEATTFNVTASYSANSNGPSGGAPIGGVIKGKDGYLYGTASGGEGGNGTVFKLSITGKLTDIARLGGANGKFPVAGLVQAPDGSFYGTTVIGGSRNQGTVFKVDATGRVTTLVSFTGLNGYQPIAGLILGKDGALYGTTYLGGHSRGTVFRLTLDGQLTTLVSFKGYDGAYPGAALLEGSDGNFYGTTSGGDSNLGTIFQLTPAGELKTLAVFTGPNGALPAAALIEGEDGTFFGTTTEGGAHNHGTVFQLSPDGVIQTLVSFDGTNGSRPASPLYQTKNGFLYGTTQKGGVADKGTAFQVAPDGELTTLVTFNGTNGAFPESGLVEGPRGVLYGTTPEGGASDLGVIYALGLTVPTKAQTITFPPITGARYKDRVALKAKASSKLPVTYKVISGKATISGNFITFTGVGPVVVSASQAGNQVYKMARQVRITIPVAKARQTIAPFKPIAPQFAPNWIHVDIPVASSGLPVKPSVFLGIALFVNVPEFENLNLVLTTPVLPVVLQANQPGNALYEAAPTVYVGFEVKPYEKLPDLSILGPSEGKVGQTLIFATANMHPEGPKPILKVRTGTATLNGTFLTINGDGDVVLELTQAAFDQRPEAHALHYIHVTR